MNQSDLTQSDGYSRKLERWLALAAAAVIATTAILFAVYPSYLGTPQPIAFSHRLHNQVKEISCIFCHDTVLHSAEAGIPPLQRCMLCHSKIIVEYPPIINNLQVHYHQKTPIPWEKINHLPDYVQFHHGIHIAAGFDCGRCHGDVSAMDRIVLAHEFTMGFCIECHRDENASTDCFNCHH